MTTPANGNLTPTPRPTRRVFLRALSGAGLVATLGTGAVALGGCDEMPASALAPWAGPKPGLADARLRLLAWALLAPNPHNLQPWRADLRREGEILLSHDAARMLPETDPFGRQLLIGHGTFQELLTLAACASGLRAEIEPFPEGVFAEDRFDGRPVARVRLASAGAGTSAGATRDPLFDAIPRRRSTKAPFDMARPLGDADAEALQSIPVAGGRIVVTRDPALVAELRRLVMEAFRVELSTPRTLRESVDVMRLGTDAIARDPDGIALSGNFIWWGRKLGLITPETLATPGSTAWKGGLDRYEAIFTATPAFGWLITRDNTRTTQLAAGRAYARLDLTAAARGVAIHPVSQLLQEYPEMTELQRRFERTVGVAPGERVQMLVRLGHAALPGAAPRRGVEALLLA
jgi:nitroreductase